MNDCFDERIERKISTKFSTTLSFRAGEIHERYLCITFVITGYMHIPSSRSLFHALTTFTPVHGQIFASAALIRNVFSSQREKMERRKREREREEKEEVKKTKRKTKHRVERVASNYISFKGRGNPRDLEASLLP